MTAHAQHTRSSTAALTLQGRPGSPLLAMVAIDAAVVAFFVGTSGALYWTGIASPERYVWLLADAALLIWILRHPHRLLALARDNRMFLSWALLAMVSAAWSLSPWVSFYQGTQLLLTILLAVALGSEGGGMRLQRQLFVALSICQVLTLVALVLRPRQAIGLDGTWAGAFHHKNTLGSCMALQIITGLSLLLSGWRRIPVLITTAVAAVMLLRSASGASAVMLAVALLPLPLALCFRASPRLAGLVLGSGLLLMAIAFAVLAVSGTDPVALILEPLGKDATLTGRTILWHFGIEAFAERPMLGHGYRGYWEASTTAVFHLRTAIGQELWHFHNNVIESLVSFGVLGPIAIFSGLAVATTRTIRAFAATGAWPPFWALQVVVAITVSSLAENVLIVNHGFLQVLLVAVVVATTRQANREVHR